MKPDEATLVKACIKHDQKACRQLYDSFAPRMFGICLRYARSREAAEDILHDGFIKVFENLRKLHEDAVLEPWIARVMVNTAISSLRHESKMETVGEFAEVDKVCDYSDTIDGSIDAEIILKAIQQLPSAYRMAFNLCEIEGYSYEDVSKELGIAESTVRSNYFRARRILAEKLEYLKKDD